MRSVILLLLCVTGFVQVKGQIGINTENPIALFHIDTNKNNDSGGSNADDIVITNQGDLGIGTISPDAKVDIRGKFRYVDGNEVNKYILISDASGNARWGEEPDPFFIQGDVSGAMANISNQYKLIGPKITLEPGNWMISYTATYRMNNAPGIVSNIYWELSNSSASLVSVGQAVSNPSKGISAATYGFATVFAVYLVFPKVKTTYYMWAKATNLPNGAEIEYSGERNIWAVAIGNKKN